MHRCVSNWFVARPALSLSVLSASLLFPACSGGADPDGDTASSGQTSATTAPTTQSATFDASASDPRAIAVADRVMAALGGEAAWNETRYIRWTFVGRRTLLWDKFENRCRIDFIGAQGLRLTGFVDLETLEGTGFVEGDRVVGDDGEQFESTLAGMWVNDAYWLAMPFKMKDPGVTLLDVGTEQTTDGRTEDVVALTFGESVGLTPEHKYHVHVDQETDLVTRWAFFRDAGDDAPTVTNVWTNWQQYGDIMLSDDRGQIALTDLAVFETVPDHAFTSPEPLSYDGATLVSPHPPVALTIPIPGGPGRNE